jgi:hypothetical protein
MAMAGQMEIIPFDSVVRQELTHPNFFATSLAIRIDETRPPRT